jgi:6-pyruvoyltetrahydropterin/6-carboxytetrahydropterin synthase
VTSGTGDRPGTVSLTRRVQFAAAHRYRRAEWNEARNEAAFGKCARLEFHGHTYTVDITVSGAVDATTGMIVDLRLLDAAIAAEVTARFDHRTINLDVAEFREPDGLIPTGENLALVIAERVQHALGPSPRVTRVVVAEDPTLSSTWRAAAG